MASTQYDVGAGFPRPIAWVPYIGRGKPAPTMLGALFFQMPSVCRTFGLAQFARFSYFGASMITPIRSVFLSPLCAGKVN